MNRLAALGCIAVALVFPCALSAQLPADYLTISTTGGPGAYTLTANYVTSHPASHAPSGNVTFQDTTYSNATVASAPFASTRTLSGLSVVSLPSIASGNMTLYGAAAKDFDGDGKLDVLLIDSSEHLNFVKGNGDGSFQTAQVEQSVTTDSFIVADVNGDTKLDLIVTNSTTGTISLRLGNGDGTFQAPVLLFAGTSVLSGDFNGDGKFDLYLFNGSSGSLYPGNGDGTFGSAIASPLATGSAVGDFNHDGIADITGGSTTLLGQSSGSFQEVVLAASVAGQPGDFDGDGKLDLISYGPGANFVSIYSGNGDGTFQAAITIDVVPDASWFSWNYKSLAVADLNADGVDEFFLVGGAYRSREDAIFGYNGITVFSLFSRSSDGSFSKRVYSIGNSAGDFLPYASALVGDLTAGGPTGILVLTPYASSSAVLVPSIAFTTTAANAFFTPAGTHGVRAVYPGDTNYAAITSSTNVQGSSAQTALTLSVTPTSSGYDDPVDVTITATPCSVSGQSCTGNLVTLYDGATNVGVYYPTSAGVVHFTSRSFSQGTHVFSATFAGNSYFSFATSNTVTLTVGPPARIIGALSLSMNYGTPDNYTLEADLTVPSVNGTPTGSVSFIDTSNNNAVIGTATFDAATPKLQTVNTTQLGAAETQILYAADFDSDGKQDLLNIDGSPTVLHGNGDGTFTGNLSTSGWSTYPYAVAKLNSDQILDVVVAYENSMTIFLGNGDGTFLPLSSISDNSDMVSPILAGDFNGDGKQDLYNGTTGKIFFGNGNGAFQSGVTTSIKAQLSGDFNGDGRTDLFGPDGVFLGHTDGTFTTVSAPSAYVTGALVADFNGDGKLDVFTTGNALMLGNGDGSFQAPITVDLDAGVSYSLGHPRYFTGDFNGDGKPDVGVVLDLPSNYSYLVVAYGDGTGHFANKNVTLSRSSSRATLLNAIPPYLPDFNGDGASDVAAFQENVPDQAGSNTSIVLYSAHNVSSAIATGLSVSAPPSGNHTVIASYAGDANYMDAISTSSVLLWARDAATLTLSVNPNPSDYGSQVSLTATLSPYDNDHPTDSESIDFYDGSSYITTGILSQGRATGTTVGLLPGARLITAKYSGDGYLKPATSIPVTVNVDHAPVLITWSPGAISYGMPLSSTQLNATTTAQGTVNTPVPGTFSYSPAAGTILDVGGHTLNATFTPTDNVTYNATSAQVIVTVNKANPTLTLTQVSPVSQGTSIGSSTTLQATATTTYGTPNGVVVFYDGNTQIASTLLTNGVATASVTFSTTGNHSITAAYQGDNNFNAVTSPVFNEAVGKGTPTITWPAPVAITYGTALSATQLNATSSVAGTFAYSPAPGTVLGAGSQALSVTFTPTDTANYNSVTATTTLVVNKTIPSITWVAPTAITYGTTLSATQLNATSAVAGTFVYSPAAGAVLGAGSQTLSVTFTPTDTANYNSATATTTLVVNRTTPSIAWAAPAAITYGAALSATQLNATSTVAGTFIYSPAAGTVLGTGSQTLSTTFTPTDIANYNNATGTTALVVNKATPSITVTQTSPITIGVGTGVATTFRAALAAPYGTPSGIVGFYEGVTLLGTGNLINGTTSVTTTFSSTGVHSITALYTGDANFNTVTSAAFNETVVLFGIGLAASPTTLTIKQGQSGTATITATPTGNYTGTLTFSCSNLPSSVSCSFAPATLTFNGDNQPQTTTITVNTRTTSAALMSPSNMRLASILALPLLAFNLRRRRMLQRGLLVLFAAMLLMPVSGCGGNPTTTSNAAATGQQTVTINAQPNANGGSTQSFNFSIVIEP